MYNRETKTTTNYAIIVAAGKGERMGINTPKQLLLYGSSTVLGTAVNAFASHREIDGVIITSPADGSLDEAYKDIAAKCEKKAGREAGFISIVNGGAGRGDSVKEGLKIAAARAAESGADPDKVIVLIHDAVRPGITADIISRNIACVIKCWAVCTAIH